LKIKVDSSITTITDHAIPLTSTNIAAVAAVMKQSNI